MKKLALDKIHEDLGAKMVEFAGYRMPLQYSGLKDEHLNVREKLGVFDVSHMGEFFVEGENAFDLIQKLTSNDVSKLTDGKIQYTCLPNGNGGIVDDLLVYRFNEHKFLAVVNASNIEKDWNWFVKNNDAGAELTNASDDYSLLAVQGPLAVEAMNSLADINLHELKFYNFVVGRFAGADDVIISATGYTGEPGFELYIKNKDAKKVFAAVMDAGFEYGIKPAGLAARDTLRLEMGMCLYGNDIDEGHSPIEAKLGWITKFVDGNDFIDRDRLAKQKSEGVSRKLASFEMTEKGIPRKGYKIVNEHDEEIGEVTSGTMSPSLDKGIGLGYVKTEYSKPGNEFYIQIRKKKAKALTVKLPFYKK